MQRSTLYRALAVTVTAVVAATGAILIAGCGTASSQPWPGSGSAEQFTLAADKSGHRWASAASATVTPGVQTNTQGARQCTANYTFVDNAGNVYLGQAAHCAGTGIGNLIDPDGCIADSLPLGTAVTFNRGSLLTFPGEVVGTGHLVYSSWLAMQQNGEQDHNTCAYNDFALVKVAPEDIRKVNPSVPYWGGPVGLNTTGTGIGDRVYGYGNSGLRFGIAELSPRTGQSKADGLVTTGWTHALTVTMPGIPGDSGSAFLDRNGYALGTLSTLGIGLPIVNSIGDMSHELAYARAHSGISGLSLVLGTEPFDPNR
ncbi:hypothetical protein ACFQZZ_28405 [Nocardia sp. GCM10030253]|uniref:hypothetical protein n=1 Tax=Nocardia sp. GCM10030253 TaxID=3273404 RepID=UPI003631EFCB